MPILSKDKYEKKVVAVVASPNIPDQNFGDVLNEEEIRRYEEIFMSLYNNVDSHHQFTNNVGKIVDSYIVEKDMEYLGRVIPRGSWIVEIYVDDDETFQGILDGEINGVSMTIGNKDILREVFSNKSLLDFFKPKKIGKSIKELKEEFGEDNLEISHVSLVESPSFPFSNFISIKGEEETKKGGDDDMEKEVKSFMEHMKNFFSTKSVEEETEEETKTETEEETKTETEDETKKEEETGKEEETKKEEDTEKEQETEKEEEQKEKEKELTEDYIKEIIRKEFKEVVKALKETENQTSTKSKNGGKSNTLDDEFYNESSDKSVGFYEYLGRDRNGVKIDKKGGDQ